MIALAVLALPAADASPSIGLWTGRTALVNLIGDRCSLAFTGESVPRVRSSNLETVIPTAGQIWDARVFASHPLNVTPNAGCGGDRWLLETDETGAWADPGMRAIFDACAFEQFDRDLVTSFIAKQEDEVVAAVLTDLLLGERATSAPPTPLPLPQRVTVNAVPIFTYDGEHCQLAAPPAPGFKTRRREGLQVHGGGTTRSVPQRFEFGRPWFQQMSPLAPYADCDVWDIDPTMVASVLEAVPSARGRRTAMELMLLSHDSCVVATEIPECTDFLWDAHRRCARRGRCDAFVDAARRLEREWCDLIDDLEFVPGPPPPRDW